MGAQTKAILTAWKAALRMVYPPQCPACSLPVSQEDGLCPACWAEAGFITGTRCGCCGAPLPDDGTRSRDAHAAGLRCDECLAIPRPWSRGVAALRYSGTGRRLVLTLKHGDRPDLAPVLARWLAEAAAPIIDADALIVPVPVHPRRLLKRRYNQAALIGAGLARQLGLAHRPDALRRLRNTPTQDHRNLAGRFDNQRGAIGVAPKEAAQLTGRPVLLVDDVMASGATLAEATLALTSAGAGPVSVAVVARAIKDD